MPYALDIQKEVFGEKNIILMDYNTTDELIYAVKTKDVIVGLDITAKNKSSQITVDLYYDNSNIVAGATFKEFAKITLGSFALTQTRNQLSKIWDVLSLLGKNLDSEVSQLNNFRLQLDSAKESLDTLEQKLNMVDFKEIEDTLDSQKNSISSFEKKNQDFKTELSSFKTSFIELKKEISDLNKELFNYSNDIIIISQGIDSSIQTVDDLLVLSQDDISKQLLLSQKNDLMKIKTKVSTIESFTNQISNENSSLNTKMVQAENLFNKFELESQNITSTLQGSNQTIDSMNTKLVVFKDSVNEIRGMISQARISRQEILEKLDNSSVLMSDFSVQLIEFSKIDPVVIAQPIRIYEKRLFQPGAFAFALMPIDPLIIGGITANAISIVLILTCILLTSIIVILERSEKVSLRMMLSQTNKFIFLIGKIIGQLLIALIEATIVFLVAILVFGLDLLPNLVLIYLATIIIAIAFISLGLLVSSFTKTQSTAILLSLLAVVPMLFLSGIILPLELMTPFMQIISSFLPLTAANNLLIGIIVKGLSIFDLVIEIMVLLFITLIGILAFMLKDNY